MPGQRRQRQRIFSDNENFAKKSEDKVKEADDFSESTGESTSVPSPQDNEGIIKMNFQLKSQL